MTGQLLTVAGTALFGLACGSIPFGYVAGRLKGCDIRTRGSGNIGFANVHRLFGPGWAFPVLVLDIAKGLIPTALAPRLGFVPALVGTGAVLGHVFTPWLGFRGGKGVATAIGVAALLCFRSLAAGLAVYALVLLVSGFVSISSMAFAVFLPPLTALLYPRDVSLLVFTLAMTLVILFRHTGNIRRLVRGTEPRFGPWLRLFRRHRQ